MLALFSQALLISVGSFPFGNSSMSASVLEVESSASSLALLANSAFLALGLQESLCSCSRLSDSLIAHMCAFMLVNKVIKGSFVDDRLFILSFFLSRELHLFVEILISIHISHHISQLPLEYSKSNLRWFIPGLSHW